MKKVKGLLIEYVKGASVVEFDRDNYKELYPIIKCDLFEHATRKIGNKVYDFWFDEEYLLNEKPACINCAKTATEALYTNATVKIGEKLDLRRFVLLEKTDNQTFGGYIHMGGKISTLLLIDGVISQEDANGLAMHVAANAPLYISTNDIPAEEVEKETRLQLEQAKQDPKLQGKPEAMLQNIIKGKVSKYFAESVFVEQEYLMVPGVKVGQWLKEHGVSVVKMIRFMTGEGLEKREENFAEEVAKQMA